MKKKLLVSIVALVCLIAIIVTGVLAVGYMGIEFPEFDKILKPNKDSKYHLTVNASSGGSVNITEGDYMAGETVNLVATPNAGYVFSGWFLSDNTYLSTSNIYDCVIQKNTELRANFAPEPAIIEGSGENADILLDCSPDFSFKLYCDRPDAEEYIKSQVEIVDSYYADEEDRSEYAKNFEVKSLGNGEWLISPLKNESYEEGVTYTVVIASESSGTGNDNGNNKPEKNEISFADAVIGNNSEMNFSVAKPEKEEIEYNERTVYLIDSNDSRDQVLSITDDGKVVGEEGDTPDSITLNKKYGLAVGSIFCVYNGEKNSSGNVVYNNDTLFGKVISITEKNGVYTVVYGTPDISEIFTELDVNKTSVVNFEESNVVIDQALYRQIKATILSSESFQDFAAVAEQSIVNLANEKGYEVVTLSSKNLMDQIDITVNPTVKGAGMTVDINVSINFPIKQNGKQVAQITATAKLTENIGIKTTSNITLKYDKKNKTDAISYDIRVDIKNSESVIYEFSLVNDRDGVGEGDFENAFTPERLKEDCAKAFSSGELPKYCDKTKIKSIFSAAGYGDKHSKYIDLGSLHLENDIVNYDIGLKFMLGLDFSGSFFSTSSTETNALVGISSTSKGAKTYNNLTSSIINTTSAFSGDFAIESGIGFEVYVSIAGFEKYVDIGIAGELGSYYKATGMMNAGYYAGRFESGSRLKYKGSYKAFSDHGKVADNEKSVPVIEYGNSYVVYGFKNQNKLVGGKYTIEFNQKEYPLFENNYFNINVYDIINGKTVTEKIDISGEKYQVVVEVLNGAHLKYSNGKLVVADGAPLYFEDTIKIKLIGDNVWGEFNGKKYNCYVPEITVKIVFGNEQALIESFDSPIMGHFRLLYRSYKSDDREVLNSLFDKLFGDMISVSERYSLIYKVVIVEYLDVMFDVLGDYHKEKDQEAAENKFVNEEAEVFYDVIEFMKSLMENKSLDTSTMPKILDGVVESNVMYNMIINVSKMKDVNLLTERFALVPQEVKNSVKFELEKYGNEHKNDSKAKKVVAAFEIILGF